jgi:hypothetical protein
VRVYLFHCFASVCFVCAGLNYTVDGDDKVNKIYMADDVMFMSYDVSKPPPLTNHQRRQGLTDDMPAVVGVCVLCLLFIHSLMYLDVGNYGEGENVGNN